MSYAIETKKRKFDRLLESLTEGSSPSQQDDNPNNARNKVTASRHSSFDSLKRRRLAQSLGRSTSKSSLINNYLPSSRAAFLERLETYRHVTKWHVPSTVSINAAQWAKRGWICVDVDTVACGYCGERVTVDLDVSSRPVVGEDQDEETRQSGIQQDEAADDLEVEVYEALVNRYEEMITTSHSGTCSWRKRGCDASIQRIEGLLNGSTTVTATKARLQGIIEKIGDIPTVSDLPAYNDLPPPNLDNLQEAGDKNPLKLAMCGWQYKEPDVIECKHCLRSLGLWLYRGTSPTVENLDAVDSHLDYCPWRSAEAQDTEIVLPANGSNISKKIKLPGWALVYHAFLKQTVKRRSGGDAESWSTAQPDDDHALREQQTPEQRERRMKDLMRRIKEIKKPFNVKGLLNRKDTVRT
ncbi:hypothetical protein LTR05_008336 [Lithohypha guttulata]|uniref:Uncharacterized protein n=1 Tax=Lithohypha guttulata TaxID=1690604 RepID=A0AAN7STF6_9EURO|nr:hypothetical protein LTR05_008336 [Lithohypha guttulata]